MAVRGGLLKDGVGESEASHDGVGSEIDQATNSLGDGFVGEGLAVFAFHLGGAFGVHVEAHGLGDAYGVGDLYQGICLFNLNRIEQSIEHLKLAEKHYQGENDQYLLETYQELAFALSRINRLQEALEYVDKTESLECDHAEMEVLRGHLYLEHECIDKAQERFQNAVRLSGSSHHILLRIAISLYDNDYIQLAYKMLHSLLDANGEGESNGYSYLAACAHELGYHDEYLEYLRLAVEKNPLEAQSVLGVLYPEGMSPSEYYNYEVRGENNIQK